MSHHRHSSARESLLQVRARRMRIAPTSSEQVLWQAIRGQRLGVAFRRQVVVGPYIVDFLAPRLRLIVEVDGGYHAARRQADARRERWLVGAGYRVFRIDAQMPLRDLPTVLELIAEAVVA
jgi:very-short-patch-repair endonuclease